MNHPAGQRHPFAVALAGFAVVLAGEFPLRAESPKVPFGQESHAIRYILEQLELQPLTGVGDLANADPSEILVIALGETQLLGTIPGGLKRFLERGGALLMATDRP